MRFSLDYWLINWFYRPVCFSLRAAYITVGPLLLFLVGGELDNNWSKRIKVSRALDKLKQLKKERKQNKSYEASLEKDMLTKSKNLAKKKPRLD